MYKYPGNRISECLWSGKKNRSKALNNKVYTISISDGCTNHANELHAQRKYEPCNFETICPYEENGMPIPFEREDHTDETACPYPERYLLDRSKIT